MNKVAYAQPSITYKEADWARQAARAAWGENSSLYIDAFEKRFADYIGSKYAVATSSCTGALHLGLAALGIGNDEGDEVILADTNWVATIAPIMYLGATPVLVDIERTSWCIDFHRVAEAITPRTKAIIATHLYGNLCKMRQLRAVSGKIPIIEDAAEAIGSTYSGRKAGSIGKFGVFSFHGSKTMTTGEGGMLVTNDKALYTKVRQLNHHGRSLTAKQFQPEILGYKYKMSNMQAAVGIVQLGRIDELVARKREIFATYKKLLAGVPGITLNPNQRGCESGYWMPNIVVGRNIAAADALREAFVRDDIDARIFFHPLSSFGFVQDAAITYKNEVAYDIYWRAINLPSYHDMTMKDIKRVVGAIKEALKGTASTWIRTEWKSYFNDRKRVAD